MENQRKYIDELADEASASISPEVRRDKNNKKISVKSSINFGKLTFKVIATYRQWMDFEEDFYTWNRINPSRLTACLSRPTKETKKSIIIYALQNPLSFSIDIYYGFVWPANLDNPLDKFTRKTRGTAYGKDRKEMLEIRFSSALIYAFLKFWAQKDKKPSTYPPILRKYLTRNNLDLPRVKTHSRDIVEKYYGQKFGITTDHDNFYKNYISRVSLQLIRTALEMSGYDPECALKNNVHTKINAQLIQLLKV